MDASSGVSLPYIGAPYDLSMKEELMARAQMAREVADRQEWSGNRISVNRRHEKMPLVILTLLQAGLTVHDYTFPQYSIVVNRRFIVTNGGGKYLEVGARQWKPFDMSTFLNEVAQ